MSSNERPNDRPNQPPSSPSRGFDPNAQKGSIKVIQKAPQRPAPREEARVSMAEIFADAARELTAGLTAAKNIAEKVFGPGASPETVFKVYSLFLDEINGDEPEEDTDEEEETE